MGYILIAWIAIVGVATYTLFNGLVMGMPALDVAMKCILKITCA